MLKRVHLGFFLALILAGCTQLETIPYTPSQTPEGWLLIQPYAEFQLASHVVYLIQPSTSAIVYLLGLITIAAGAYFLRIRNEQCTRLWWGIALLLWGAGALLAGTSYEAFSYAIKCAGREYCVWTSGWEVLYLLFSVASVDAMLVAVAYSSASGKLRQTLITYAGINLAAYLIILLTGVLVPIKFLISFELLLVMAAPSILIFLIINTRRYMLRKGPLDKALLGAWAWLILTIAAYFLYLLSGLTGWLWAQGMWFTENDVLHIGLIIWMVYLAHMVAPLARDEQLVHMNVGEIAVDLPNFD